MQRMLPLGDLGYEKSLQLKIFSETILTDNSWFLDNITGFNHIQKEIILHNVTYSYYIIHCLLLCALLYSDFAYFFTDLSRTASAGLHLAMTRLCFDYDR